ncbi:hypothetical protein BVY02_00095 [bacterium J17]|nr:hypothetical protein BVY02_00095 [bacterium J17]
MTQEHLSKNVMGGELELCCADPETGFFRDGFCHTSPQDLGSHTVCAEMTEEFLKFSKSQGNDLSTPRPEFDFPGLKPGDRWCVCASRWQEALEAGCACPVILRSSNEKALEYVDLKNLKKHALDLN